MKNKKLARMPIRVVFYRDRDEKSVWVAHCLEFDLLGNGATWDEAMGMLTESIGIQLKNTLKSKNLDNLFSPAPAEFQMMFACGKDVVDADLTVELHVDNFEIDEVEFREYDADAAERHLAHA